MYEYRNQRERRRRRGSRKNLSPTYSPFIHSFILSSIHPSILPSRSRREFEPSSRPSSSRDHRPRIVRAKATELFNASPQPKFIRVEGKFPHRQLPTVLPDALRNSSRGRSRGVFFRWTGSPSFRCGSQKAKEKEEERRRKKENRHRR
jgi:hypothetical protein